MMLICDGSCTHDVNLIVTEVVRMVLICDGGGTHDVNLIVTEVVRNS